MQFDSSAVHVSFVVVVDNDDDKTLISERKLSSLESRTELNKGSKLAAFHLEGNTQCK